MVGFEKTPGDGVMKVELPDNSACILCTQPGKQDACKASDIPACKDVFNPDELQKTGSGWFGWDSLKCTSCKASLLTVAGGAQVLLDASGEAGCSLDLKASPGGSTGFTMPRPPVPPPL